MKDATTPSLVRIRRVNYFLGQEPKFATSTVTEDYVKGTEKIPFPKPTWDVARAIHQADLDPCQMDKSQIFEWANFVLLNGPAPKEAPKEVPAVAADAQAPKTAAPETSATTASEHEEPVATINVPVRVAIYTLLVSARELTRLDRKQDSEELGKLIDPVAVKYLSALNQSERAYLTASNQNETRAKQPEAAAVSVPPPIVTQTPPQVPTPA